MEILIRLSLIFLMHGMRLRNQPIRILSFTPVHAAFLCVLINGPGYTGKWVNNLKKSLIMDAAKVWNDVSRTSISWEWYHNYFIFHSGVKYMGIVQILSTLQILWPYDLWWPTFCPNLHIIYWSLERASITTFYVVICYSMPNSFENIANFVSPIPKFILTSRLR